MDLVVEATRFVGAVANPDTRRVLRHSGAKLPIKQRQKVVNHDVLRR